HRFINVAGALEEEAYEKDRDVIFQQIQRLFQNGVYVEFSSLFSESVRSFGDYFLEKLSKKLLDQPPPSPGVFQGIMDLYKFEEAPEDFSCQLTHNIMIDPVYAPGMENIKYNKPQCL